MTRRLLLPLLVVLVAGTVPAFAKRRGVTPGGPSHCVRGTVAESANPFLMTRDATHVFWIDDTTGEVHRASLSSSHIENLGVSLGGYIPWVMTMDETNLYFGASPGIAAETPTPGVILTVPKNGGVLSTLVSGVLTPFDVEVDATHVYWAAAGTLDFQTEHVAPDGKIERVKKDGTERQTLAENLSAPTDVELDGAYVWYGETGQADGDPTVGVYRVPKAGGVIEPLNTTIMAPALAVTSDAVVVEGGTSTVDGGIIRVPKNGSAITVLARDSDIYGAPIIFDGQVYYITAGAETNSLWVVPLDSSEAELIRDDLYFGADFFVDACAITAAISNGDIVRF
jgi:hypothetical protein